jgi:hypothetical protein
MKSGVENVTTREKGFVISVDPECRLSLVAEDGNPHELAQALAAIQGKRVRVQITLEQPELFAEPGEHSAGDLEQSAADVEPMQDQ